MGYDLTRFPVEVDEELLVSLNFLFAYHLKVTFKVLLLALINLLVHLLKSLMTFDSYGFTIW
jgi:hypothetical protein